MRNQQHAGWTLIETLFVLAIICSLGLLWIPKNIHTSPTQQEDQFIEDFHSLWLMAISTAILTNQKVTIIDGDNHWKQDTLVYYAYVRGEKKSHSPVVIPSSLSLGHHVEIVIRPHGVVSPQTIWLESKTGRNINFIPQMGWGLYSVKIWQK